MKVTVYGKGGYDPSKPNNNIIEEYDDKIEDIDPLAAVKAKRDRPLTEADRDAVLDQLIRERLSD